MKRLSLIIMLALSVVMLTQCKKEKLEDNNASSGEKVRVRCEIPMGNCGKSDFSSLLEDGSVQWSAETEHIYVAIGGENHQLVELTATPMQETSTLIFEGAIDADLLTDGQEYQLWYFGNSLNSENPYVQKVVNGNVITSVEGSIANQSGKISDLGYHHIAMTTVTAAGEGDEISLILNGTLENQIAIAYMDLTGITKLSGDAVIGTDYVLQYNSSTSKYEFAVTESADAAIDIAEGNAEAATAFVVLLPNPEKKSMIENNKGTYYVFKEGVEAGKLYKRPISDVEADVLKWEGYEYHEYVDLGLSVKWATCNVGANTPEEYGDYFAWGAKRPYERQSFINGTSSIDDLRNAGIIDEDNNLTPSYDAATVNWGAPWRMPTKQEMEDLVNECNWDWITQNGVNGYIVTGKNGNSIFLPAGGFCMYVGDDIPFVAVGEGGFYNSSSIDENQWQYSYTLLFDDGDYNMNPSDNFVIMSIRPVSE